MTRSLIYVGILITAGVFAFGRVQCNDEPPASESLSSPPPETGDQFEKMVLKAMKEEGLLDDWKKKLDEMIYEEKSNVIQGNDDEAEKFTSKLKCAKDKDSASSQPDETGKLSKPSPKTMDEVEDALKQLLGTDDTKKPEEIKATPEVVGELENLLKVAQDLLGNSRGAKKVPEQKKASKQQKPKKQKKPDVLQSLVGPLKELIGHDDSNPTLDIVANMASSYLQNSGSDKKDSNSGMDWTSLLQLASMFGGQQKDLNIMDMLGAVTDNFNLDLGQVLGIANTLMGQPQGKAKTDSSESFIDTIVHMLAGFLGVDPATVTKYYTGLSSLALANNFNQVKTILHDLTGADLEELTSVMESSDFREQLAESMSSKFFSWIQDFLEPQSLRMKLFFVNGFLLQNQYPAIDADNLIKSSSAVLDKAAKEYLGYSTLNSESYMRNLEKQVKTVMKLGAEETVDLRRYTTADLVDIGKSIALNEVVEPFARSLADFSTAVENPRCAEMIFCYANMPLAVKTPLGLKAAITRACSTFAVWALTRVNKPGTPTFTRLHEAAWNGASGEACMEKYSASSCDHLLSGPKLLLKPDYERTEL